jgi:hypothetical protein
MWAVARPLDWWTSDLEQKMLHSSGYQAQETSSGNSAISPIFLGYLQFRCRYLPQNTRGSQCRFWNYKNANYEPFHRNINGQRIKHALCQIKINHPNHHFNPCTKKIHAAPQCLLTTMLLTANTVVQWLPRLSTMQGIMGSNRDSFLILNCFPT